MSLCWRICLFNEIMLVKWYQMCYLCSSCKLNGTSHNNRPIISKNWKKSSRKITTEKPSNTADKFSCKDLALPRCRSTVAKKSRLTMFISSIIIAVLLRQSFSSFHQEIFLPRSGGFGWIRSTDPVDCMSPSLGQIWSRSIYSGCSDHSIYSAFSNHLNLFMFYLINLVVIGWPG